MPPKDKINKYQKAIITLLQDYNTRWGNTDGLKNQIVVDTKNNTFVFLTYGWQNSENYTHLLCFHLEIIEGKVWVHENNTDAMIAVDLIQHGVNPEDIVLGFATLPALPNNQKLVLAIISNA
jgi:XisI protein